MKKTHIVIITFILAFLLSACSAGSLSASSVEAPAAIRTPVPTQEPLPSAEPVPSEEQIQSEKNITRYEASTYKVGNDMPAGEYVVFCDSLMGYIEIAKDSSGELEAIIANENIETFSIATVSDDQYFTINGGYAVPIEECKELNITGPGMYKVGYHIPAGEYKLEVDDNNPLGYGYFQVSKDSTHSFDSIVANDMFEGTKYVTVSIGQYLTVTGSNIVERPLSYRDLGIELAELCIILAEDDYAGYVNGDDNIGDGEGGIWPSLSASYDDEDAIMGAAFSDLEIFLANGDSEFADYWSNSVAVCDYFLSGTAEQDEEFEGYQETLQAMIEMVQAQ